MPYASHLADRTKPRTEDARARCSDCAWGVGGSLGLEATQRYARQHVAETGHRVAVRSVRVTVYKPKAGAS